MGTAGVGNVAGVVSLPAPGALGLAARVRDQGGGRAQRPGRVPPLGEDELSAAEELLLDSVHRALDHGVRVVKKGEGGINQVGPGAGHSLLRLDFNYIKLDRYSSSVSNKRDLLPTTTPQPTKRSFLVDALYRLSRDSGLHQRPDKYKTAVR